MEGDIKCEVLFGFPGEKSAVSGKDYWLGVGVLSVLSFRLNSGGRALQIADGPEEKQCCNSENVSVLSPS